MDCHSAWEGRSVGGTGRAVRRAGTVATGLKCCPSEETLTTADRGDSGFVQLNTDQSCLIMLPGTEEIAGAWTQEGEQILLRLDGETQTLLILGDVLQLRLNYQLAESFTDSLSRMYRPAGR